MPAANYAYYEPRTDHGSSLSPSIHAAVAARLGLRREAERYWRRSLWLDLTNAMGNTAHGVHGACLGGTSQALVFGFLDVRMAEMMLTWRSRRVTPESGLPAVRELDGLPDAEHAHV